MPIYAKINASMATHDKLVNLPSDAARWAFLRAILAAKQRENPTFSLPALREELGSYSRHIPTLVRAKLIDHRGDAYSIHDFDDWQGPQDTTAAQRQKDWREREKKRRAEHENAGSAHVTNSGDNPLGAVTDNALRNDVTVTGQSRAEQSREGTEKKVSSSAREPGDDQPETTDDLPDEPRGIRPIFGIRGDDLRFGVAALLKDRFRFTAISEAQWDMLDFFVDNEFPFDHRRGYAEVARMLDRLPRDAGEPLAAIKAEIDRRIAERLAKAEAADLTRAQTDARTINQEQASIEAAKANGVTEADAAAHRKQLADFADALGSPSPKPAQPRRQQPQEGSAP